ncbi:hypothetical protein [Bacillus sp. FJAT-47783]|uniref:hypothetical protein n=1 Tax=Bacillus sp. FJAT-47783 TaxID=2922712 RepID=UPI001FAD6BB9|nr:hypothetical protein [Bacillus sp. FJAT-47783]
MKWDTFMIAILVIFAIIAYEWPKMKQNPLKDKAAFLTLLLLAGVLSLFDLPNMAGPPTFIEWIFKPISKIMEN